MISQVQNTVLEGNPAETHRKSHEQSALTILDDASFTKHHIRAMVVAGVGFLADQYDLFVM